MKRIGFLLIAIGVWCSAHAQNITAIEYFFDADPGYGSGTSVSFTAAASINNLNFNVPVTSISDGFHIITVRAKDANNRWSHAFTRPFYKLSSTAVASAPNITKLEYFFDNDPGYGAGTNVSITPGTSITDQSVTVPLTSGSDGFHTITFRAQDANGNWSHAFNRPFYKLPASTGAAAPNITKLEYFVDNDPGYGAGTNVTITPGTSIVDLNVNAALTSLADGFHIITFRAQNASDNWSHAFNRPFYKLPASTGATAPNITKLEYFVDNDPGYGAGTNVTITPGTSIVDLNVNAALTSVADGFHTITFRTQDASGKWSHAFTRPFYKLPAAAVAAAPNITKLEYFIDDDPGYGLATDVPVTPAITISSLPVDISVNSLSPGTHTIHFRAKDAYGNWSLVYTASFGVFGPPPAAQPTAIKFENITTTAVKVSFTPAAPAPDGGYIAIRKTGSAPTIDPTDGKVYAKGNNIGAVAADGTVAYVGTATSFDETGLTAGTSYYYKIYAYNGSSTLTNYLTTNPLAGNTTTLFDPVTITSQSFPATYDKGSTLTVSVNVNNAARVSTAILKYKGISEPASAWKTFTLTASGNQYGAQFSVAGLTDLIGMKYEFEITDLNQTKITRAGKSNLRYPASSTEQLIPDLSFGADKRNYQIIAVPLTLTNNDVGSVFSVFMNSIGYDQSKWRLFDYTFNDNREYAAFNTIVPGKGYWLISRNNASINPGAGTTVSVDEDTPFTITLTPGWNLIGNPYNFRISWAEVLSASGNPTTVSSKISLFSNGALSDGDVLDRYRGGFVRNTGSSNVDIKIPVVRNTTLGGGRKSEIIDLKRDAWELSLSIGNGELTNMRGGIGMHPKASINETDSYDAEPVPLLDGLGMPELLFSTAYKAVLSKEVVPTQKNYTWHLSVNQISEEGALITWPKVDAVVGKQLVLLDLATQRIVDMISHQEIKLAKETKQLKIFYGDPEYVLSSLEKELPIIGQPYPNPAQREVTIPFFISESLDNARVTIRIYDGMGKEIEQLIDDVFRKGYHQLQWKHAEPAGLYIVSMKVGTGEERRVKLIIQ